MTARTFTLEDQIAFAKLSGDYNPMHVDPIAARRLIFGEPVVHGIHSLLWALDIWSRDKPPKVRLASLSAEFRKPILIHREIRCESLDESGPSVRLRLMTGERPIAKVEFSWAHGETSCLRNLSTEGPEHTPPRNRSEEDLRAASGTLPLHFPLQAAASLFPHLAACLSSLQIAQLLATSRLVGMECPGLHSLYSALQADFAREGDDSCELSYRMDQWDPRFARMLLRIRSGGMNGMVTAFLRPAPQNQAPFAEVQRLVRREEFCGQRALIVGGSRGLGEVAAKLLAAGGAKVWITFHRGESDARKLVEEIALGGGKAACFALNVLDPKPLPSGLATTHLYYFATPVIAGGDRALFSRERLETFRTFYVDGFQRLVEKPSPDRLRGVFYPSTVFIDDAPAAMKEYVAAKKEGEAFCASLANACPSLAVLKPRLPRMATDQTVGARSTTALPDPAPVLLEHLRALRDATTVS